MANKALLMTEAVFRRCSVKKDVIKNFAKFTGKHLCGSLSFDKVASLKKKIPTNVFSCEFCETSKSTFFTEQHRWLLLC